MSVTYLALAIGLLRVWFFLYQKIIWGLFMIFGSVLLLVGGCTTH